MKTHLLQLTLILRTTKWPLLLAALLWTITFSLGGYVYVQKRVHDNHTSKINSLRNQVRTQSDSSLPLNPIKSPNEVLASTLGDSEQLEQYLRTMFEIAGKQSLNLKQGSYKTHHSISGNYDIYTIDLPITGQYIKIKSISEQMLLALPFSALEEIKFKRKMAGDATLETQLRFMLFLKPTQTLTETGKQS